MSKRMKLRPSTAEQYVDLVDQAIFEIEDLRMAMEYDMESMGGASPFLERLEKEVRALRQSMADGSYCFGTGPLPFMVLVDQADEKVLPFKHLLHVINQTHLNGLEVDET